MRWLVLFMFAGAAVAQDNPVVVHSGLDPRRPDSGSSARGTPTFELLPQSPSARRGRIWITNSTFGLTIQGEVDGPKPAWPSARPEILSKDHIEVWLAAEPKLTLPPIGWGNQFGENHLASENACNAADAHIEKPDACKAWFHRQVKYREQFNRLFVRQWLLAGNPANALGQSVESYAQPALQNIAANFFAEYAPTAIAPALNDGIQIRLLPYMSAQAKYAFEIDVPYSAFPPVPALSVRDLWIMVDIFSAAPDGKRMGAFSTTAPHRKWGDPGTFNHVRLDQPLQLKLSPCAYPLAQPDVYGNDQPAFVYPIPSDLKENAPMLIDSVVSVTNPAGGYAYDPTGASPEAQVKHVFFKATGDGGFACGPKLAYVKGSIRLQSDEIVDPKSFDTKVLPEGWTLVKSGPRADYTPFGSGQCGACPRAQLNVFAISPQ
jgi:hypothetical protein